MCVCVCVCVCVSVCVCVFKVPKNSGISNVNIALIWLKTVKKNFQKERNNLIFTLIAVFFFTFLTSSGRGYKVARIFSTNFRKD